MVNNKKELGTGSIFWIIFILIGFIGLIYLGIWSHANESIRGISLAVIFGLMIIGSIAITKGEIFRMGGSWSAESFSFTLLFWIFFLFGVGGTWLKAKGIGLFSLTGNTLFATIRSNLPISAEAIMDIVIIPIAEEQIWIIALPIMLYKVMEMIGENKKLQFFNNNWVQMLVVILVSSATFAIFHVGNIMLISFIIAAVIFRTLVIVLFWGDEKSNIFSGFTLYVSGVLGAHSGNNLSQYGLSNALQAISSSFAGILLIGFYLFIFASAIYFVYKKLVKGGVKS